MTQAQPNHKPSLGAAAAAAATTGAKPNDAKPADAKPADDKGTGSNAEPDKKKRESKRKVFIIKGDLNTDNVLEFESVVQAEKFLNSDDPNVPGVYTVLTGMRTKTRKKVSLR